MESSNIIGIIGVVVALIALIRDEYRARRGGGCAD